MLISIKRLQDIISEQKTTRFFTDNSQSEQSDDPYIFNSRFFSDFLCIHKK